MLPKAPLLIRVPVLVVSAAVAVSALGGLFWSLTAGPALAPGVVGFEAIILLSAAFGVMFGLGMFRPGFGLGVLTLGGTIAVAAGLSYLDGRVNLPETLRPTLRAMTAARVGLGAAMAGLAGAAVLARSGESVRLFLRGAVLGLIPAAILGAGYAFRGAMLSPADGGLEALRVLGLLVGSLVVIVLVSVSLGMVIRSFEIGPGEPKPMK